MREQTSSPEITELGAASEVTLGIPKVDELEDFETPDFRD